MIDLSNFMVVIFCISAQIALSIDPSSKNIPVLSVEEIPVNTELSLNSFAQHTHTRHQSRGKHQRIIENDKQQERNVVWGYQSINNHLSEKDQTHGQRLDGLNLSLDSWIAKPLPVDVIRSQDKQSTEELFSEKRGSGDHLSLDLSISQGGLSHIQKTSDQYHVPKNNDLKQPMYKEGSRMVSNGRDWGSPPGLLKMVPTTPEEIKAHIQEHRNDYGSEAREKLNNISNKTSNSDQRKEGIDIQNFYLHTPDKMCSAAANYYTLDLFDTILTSYKHQRLSLDYPSRTAARQMWAADTLLPFVYFIVSCNPNLDVWNMVKTTTAYIFKTYHNWCFAKGTDSDQEKLARFILWHTEVIYHILQLGPRIKSSQGKAITLTMDIKLMAPKLSTLARMFNMLNSDFHSLKHKSRGWCVLERHISETFERDYQLGYPINTINQNIYDSVWKKWRAKSDEITHISKDVHWPECLKPQRSNLEPILLLNGDSENDTKIMKDPQVSEFITLWERDFIETMIFLKNSNSANTGFPPVTLKDFGRGIHTYLQDRVGRSSIYEVTLFSNFLHQDPQDRVFANFWHEFRGSELGKFRDSQNKRKARVLSRD